MKNVTHVSDATLIYKLSGLCGAGFQPAADFNRPADQSAQAAQAGYKPAAG
jgi:hypothetical protein